HENYAITQVKNINGNTGNGSLPSTYVHSIAEDQDGEVWVGTENGFIIFYNPEVVFSNSSFNGVIPVVVASDGNNEKLLDGVFVKDIFVDGG
ncbi:two-component regulator propeller domain-containing protein, partial [Salmonella enterica]|uniref:two-component regulator propeller domain-containing protein n=1 Tax=Salmonella enterica TaxID=28901 RepID=UPI0020A2678A